jgi:hypothetical protein
MKVIDLVPGDIVCSHLYPGVAICIDNYHCFYEYSYDIDDYIEYELTDRFDCHMFGDDDILVIDAEDLQLMHNEFCRGCGQLGCSWH